MSGRRFHLSTTDRVIKGAWRAGPSSGTRGKRPSAGRRLGAEGGWGRAAPTLGGLGGV